MDARLGERIRTLRRARGLSQEALAEVLERSPQQVQKYETGKTRISVGVLMQMAAALGARPSALLPGDPTAVCSDEGLATTVQLMLSLPPTSQELVRTIIEALAAPLP